jgi:ketosteroid isomerase-like protein
MNKLFFTVLIILGSFSLVAQSETLAKEQIKLVMKFQEQNWNRGDIPAYMHGYWKSDSLLFIGSKGPTYGWSSTLTNYLKSYPSKEAMGQLSFDLKKVKILSAQHAYVVGKWQLDRENDTLKGYFSLLWEKIGEEWKIISDHSSSE